MFVIATRCAWFTHHLRYEPQAPLRPYFPDGTSDLTISLVCFLMLVMTVCLGGMFLNWSFVVKRRHEPPLRQVPMTDNDLGRQRETAGRQQGPRQRGQTSRIKKVIDGGDAVE